MLIVLTKPYSAKILIGFFLSFPPYFHIYLYVQILGVFARFLYFSDIGNNTVGTMDCDVDPVPISMRIPTSACVDPDPQVSMVSILLRRLTF